MWTQISLFSASSDFEAKLYHENFKITFFLITSPNRDFAQKSTNKWLKYHQKKVEKHAKIQKNHGFLTDFLFDFIELYCVFQHSLMIS
jgi:hypothetical protein